MVPTIPWVRSKFDTYNKKYFGGRLPTPEFKICPLGGEWGRYDLNARYYKGNRKIFEVKGTGTLSLTSDFDRTENAIVNTLLHEMIHEYVYLILRVYPKDEHGEEFMNIANKINADGWEVEEVTFMTDTDKNASIQNSIVLIISKPRGTDYKYWLCPVDPSQIEQFRATASKIPGIKFDFYELGSPCLRGQPSDPSTLLGWRGMSYVEMIDQICKDTGANKSDFNRPQRYIPPET